MITEVETLILFILKNIYIESDDDYDDEIYDEQEMSDKDIEWQDSDVEARYLETEIDENLSNDGSLRRRILLDKLSLLRKRMMKIQESFEN